MTASAPRAFVIGHPIGHSRSPLIHGHWLREHGLAGSYERIDVPPAELSAFLRDAPGRGFAGGNVTMPLKEAALGLVHDASAHASRIGAVNTLSWTPEGRLAGDCTDGFGFVASLDEEAGPGWETGEAIVLGAGGAARAIAAALLDRGSRRIHLVNRTGARAEALRGLDPVRLAVADRLADVDPSGVTLLVNTTTLGMTGQPPLAADLSGLGRDTVVADIVYVPRETALLRDARARGLRTVGGLGMLLHQAVPGFASWFGIRPAVTPALRRTIEADIESRR